MDPMSTFAQDMEHLVETKTSTVIAPFLTQYSVWIYISVVVFLIVMFVAAKKVRLIPKPGIFSGGVDHLIDWLRTDIGYNIMGKDADKHLPFLITLFLFILTCNLIGLIPGVYVATGALGSTLALAVVSFVYFNYYGIKKQGFVKYSLSFAPTGVLFPMNLIVWVIELFSTFLRLVTLSVRLFANMYAGHLVLGSFALLCSAYISPLIQDFTVAAVGGALPGVLWLVFLMIMYFLELMFACRQAYVFTMLSSVYVQLAIHPSH